VTFHPTAQVSVGFIQNIFLGEDYTRPFRVALSQNIREIFTLGILGSRGMRGIGRNHLNLWCREGESNPQGPKYRRILSPTHSFSFSNPPFSLPYRDLRLSLRVDL
jgi:hypothetical protein